MDSTSPVTLLVPNASRARLVEAHARDITASSLQVTAQNLGVSAGDTVHIVLPNGRLVLCVATRADGNQATLKLTAPRAVPNALHAALR